MDQHIPSEAVKHVLGDGRIDFKTEMLRRRQFEDTVPLAFIAIGQLMLERGLKVRGGIDANKYDRRIQITVDPAEIPSWEAAGEVIGSKCSMVESPFGPTRDRHYTRVETTVRVGLIEFDLVSYHDVPVDTNVTPLVAAGGAR